MMHVGRMDTPGDGTLSGPVPDHDDTLPNSARASNSSAAARADAAAEVGYDAAGDALQLLAAPVAVLVAAY